MFSAESKERRSCSLTHSSIVKDPWWSAYRESTFAHTWLESVPGSLTQKLIST